MNLHRWAIKSTGRNTFIEMRKYHNESNQLPWYQFETWQRYPDWVGRRPRFDSPKLLLDEPKAPKLTFQFSSSMWLHKCMGAKAGAYIAHTHIAFIFQHSPRPMVLFKQHFRGFHQFPWTMIPQDSIGTSGSSFTGANRKLMQIEF